MNRRENPVLSDSMPQETISGSVVTSRSSSSSSSSIVSPKSVPREISSSPNPTPRTSAKNRLSRPEKRVLPDSSTSDNGDTDGEDIDHQDDVPIPASVKRHSQRLAIRAHISTVKGLSERTKSFGA